MTSYNRDYQISQDTKLPPYGRELTPLERETVKRVKAAKQARQEVIARAQAREKEAARQKAQREHEAANGYDEYDPA